MNNAEQIVDPISQACEEGNQVSLDQGGRILKAILRPNPQIREEQDSDLRRMLVFIGHGGEGKTSRIHQVVAELGAELAVFHMGSTVEEDNNGLPFIDRETGITRIAKPEHIPCFTREPASPTGLGVLLVEECLSGQIMHQNFLRSIIDGVWPNGDRMYKGWKIIGTTNPETAEYATVKAADRALACRMHFVYVRATAEEKMRYWSGRMQPTLFNFLLLNHVNNIGLNVLDRLDSRSWYFLANDIEKVKLAGEGNKVISGMLRTHCGSEIETMFLAYLAKGSDPEQYPISHKKLLLGDDQEVKDSLARIGRWIANNEVPLLGATKWELKAFFKNNENLNQLKDDAKFCRLVTNNLSAFMIDLGKGGYAEHAEDLCHTLKEAASKIKFSFFTDVLKKIKGTPLEKTLLDLYEAHSDAKVRSEQFLAC